MKRVENKQRASDIAIKVLDELLAMELDDLLDAINQAPDTSFGRFMMESGAHDIIMAEHEKRKAQRLA